MTADAFASAGARADYAHRVLQGEAEAEHFLLKQVLMVKAKADATHGPMRSYHETYGVLMEECHEFFEHVMSKSSLRHNLGAKNELIDIIVACLRGIEMIEGMEKR